MVADPRKRAEAVLEIDVRADTDGPAAACSRCGGDRCQFWELIAAGRSSEGAAVEVGVSQPVVTRWFREAGGMPPNTFGTFCGETFGRVSVFRGTPEDRVDAGPGLRRAAHDAMSEPRSIDDFA